MKAFILFALIAVASASSIKMEEKKDSSAEKKDGFEYKYSIEGGEKKEIKTLLPTYYAAAPAYSYYAAAAPAAYYHAAPAAAIAAAPASSYNYEVKYEQAPIVKYKSSMEAIPAPAAPMYKKIEIAAPEIKEIEYKLAAPALKEYKYEWAPAPAIAAAAPMYYAAAAPAPAAAASWGYQYAHHNYAAAAPMAATYYSASAPYYYGYGYPWAK